MRCQDLRHAKARRLQGELSKKITDVIKEKAEHMFKCKCSMCCWSRHNNAIFNLPHENWHISAYFWPIWHLMDSCRPMRFLTYYMMHLGYFRCENTSGNGTQHTQSLICKHRFGKISYNKHEARTAEKPLCVCMLKDGETTYSAGSERLHKHTVWRG